MKWNKMNSFTPFYVIQINGIHQFIYYFKNFYKSHKYLMKPHFQTTNQLLSRPKILEQTKVKNCFRHDVNINNDIIVVVVVFISLNYLYVVWKSNENVFVHVNSNLFILPHPQFCSFFFSRPLSLFFFLLLKCAHMLNTLKY